MLSSALRVGHKPINRKKSREKRVEAEAPKQAPAPTGAVGEVEQRPIVWKHVALGTAAVGAQLVALSEALSPLTTFVFGGALSSNPTKFWSSWHWFYFLPNAGLALTLLLTGALFFKKQQRAPMLLNALAWIVMLQFFPYWNRPLWPCIAAALASLATAFALGRRTPEEPEAPIK